MPSPLQIATQLRLAQTLLLTEECERQRRETQKQINLIIRNGLRALRRACPIDTGRMRRSIMIGEVDLNAPVTRQIYLPCGFPEYIVSINTPYAPYNLDGWFEPLLRNIRRQMYTVITSNMSKCC